MESVFAQAPPNIVRDEVGEQVRLRFERFLEEFILEDPLQPMQIDSSQSQTQINDNSLASENQSNVQNESQPNETPQHYLVKIDRLKENDTSTLDVDFRHVVSFDQDLAEAIELQFYRLTPFLRRAIQNVVRKRYPDFIVHEDRDREFWISFYNSLSIYKIRELNTSKLGKLSCIKGTVTRTSEVRPELVYGSFQCLDCRVNFNNVEQQFRYTEPLQCKNPMCNNTNRWQLNVENSKFVDWQKVRVQENSEEIPSGAMPRSLDIILRHEEVEKAKAGDKCLFTGCLIVVPDITKGRVPGPTVKAVSRSEVKMQGNKDKDSLSQLNEFSYKLCFLACSVRSADASKCEENNVAEEFKKEELEEIRKLKSNPKIYANLIHSIAPATFGHNEVKKGILLMLFGGVHKQTMEGINLRGDINICIVGDPSTSKSQFLKYVVGFLPRAVYTSGKASSAAGLTATVVKDPDTGEFNIEAGALMLADNGICCIDEFDKMDPKDQVAIHEAMEQQTISIAKAGIHATLNARTSILAAANPIGGRYDKAKTLKANLNVTPAIMSRFDLFFVVLDECDENSDMNIARHIVSIHQKKDEAIKPVFTTAQLQRYIKFARTLKPQMTQEAQKLLVENYRKLRQSDVSGHGKTAYRITVRQLESMIRLSEALARVHCDDEIKPEYVTEAAQLIRKSIIHVEAGEITFEAPRSKDVEESDEEILVPKRSESQADVESQENSDPNIPSNKKSATKKSTKKKKKTSSSTGASGKISISFEKYTKVAKLLLMHLSKDKPEGESQKDIVRWYLDHASDEVSTASELKHEDALVKHIIRRMVTKDKVLVVIQEDNKEEDRILVVNPNLDVASMS